MSYTSCTEFQSDGCHGSMYTRTNFSGGWKLVVYDAQNFPRGFPRKHSKCFAYKSYQLSEFCSKQTKAVCVNWVDLSLWASIGVSMITSFT